MLKIGVLGAGHLGKIHIRLIQEIKDFELIGFYDPNKEASKSVAEEFNIKAFDNIEDLIEQVDAVDIVTPTLSHFDCAVKSIKQSKHIFIEKPITNTVEEARQLIQLAEEANVKVQVGHVERFNPAFIASQPYVKHPMFIEAHRLAQFNPRGTDVSVVLDLMIHDLDIVLSMVKSNVRRISASGVAVVSDNPDITNARIEFDNGCVANLTASRISLKNMRKTRIFQKDAYISIDFLEKESEIVRLSEVVGEPDPLSVTIDLGEGKGQKEIYFEKPDVAPNNAIKEELLSFLSAIVNNTNTAVTIHDGFLALDIAHQIIDKLDITKEKFQA
ncbi:MAG: gfo/Idh/MocA family oxidoreductase [Bacteroidetes bacterium]|nr:MAG: gfo/Idh/MocA family oxidoreductase [Bacteroidota bacterium]MBL1144562.1 gfo/Idh/MocA family oxidoreductase [Bacteroidota bacterium]MCB0804115.1 Gfo/Idh/MocA family oxidoreductase [Flavobacteriales bacterium]NOG57357.1 Gfo/Idh/MocA family oxidoreductase [Bacteroidota bacterium]